MSVVGFQPFFHHPIKVAYSRCHLIFLFPGGGFWEVTILRENSSHPKNGWLGSMKGPLKNNPISRFYRRVCNFFGGFSLILRQQKFGEINAHFQGPAPATLCWCDPYLMNLYFQMQVLAVSLWFGVIWLGCW